MIVDLVRNDLGRVCATGTVEVPALLALEEHPGLVHLVSTVPGSCRSGVGWPDAHRRDVPARVGDRAPRSRRPLRIIDCPRAGSAGPVLRGGRLGRRRHADGRSGRRRSARSGSRTACCTSGPGRASPGARTLPAEWAETELKAARWSPWPVATGRQWHDAMGRGAAMKAWLDGALVDDGRGAGVGVRPRAHRRRRRLRDHEGERTACRSRSAGTWPGSTGPPTGSGCLRRTPLRYVPRWPRCSQPTPPSEVGRLRITLTGGARSARHGSRVGGSDRPGGLLRGQALAAVDRRSPRCRGLATSGPPWPGSRPRRTPRTSSRSPTPRREGRLRRSSSTPRGSSARAPAATSSPCSTAGS